MTPTDLETLRRACEQRDVVRLKHDGFDYLASVERVDGDHHVAMWLVSRGRPSWRDVRSVDISDVRSWSQDREELDQRRARNAQATAESAQRKDRDEMERLRILADNAERALAAKTAEAKGVYQRLLDNERKTSISIAAAKTERDAAIARSEAAENRSEEDRERWETEWRARRAAMDQLRPLLAAVSGPLAEALGKAAACRADCGMSFSTDEEFDEAVDASRAADRLALVAARQVVALADGEAPKPEKWAPGTCGECGRGFHDGVCENGHHEAQGPAGPVAETAEAVFDWLANQAGPPRVSTPAGPVDAECTGLTARWCPMHGDCSCVRVEQGADLDQPGCPLHSTGSGHGEGLPAPAGLCAMCEHPDHEEEKCSVCGCWPFPAELSRKLQADKSPTKRCGWPGAVTPAPASTGSEIARKIPADWLTDNEIADGLALADTVDRCEQRYAQTDSKADGDAAHHAGDSLDTHGSDLREDAKTTRYAAALRELHVRRTRTPVADCTHDLRPLREARDSADRQWGAASGPERANLLRRIPHPYHRVLEAIDRLLDEAAQGEEPRLAVASSSLLRDGTDEWESRMDEARARHADDHAEQSAALRRSGRITEEDLAIRFEPSPEEVNDAALRTRVARLEAELAAAQAEPVPIPPADAALLEETHEDTRYVEIGESGPENKTTIWLQAGSAPTTPPTSGRAYARSLGPWEKVKP